VARAGRRIAANEERYMHVVAKTMRMLIGYASRFGSTRDVAIRIGDTVRARGNDVDVRSIDEISDLDHYDAVVFGSGVYDGSWTAGANAFVRSQAGLLGHRPVWLFSLGSFTDPGADSRRSGRTHLQTRSAAFRTPLCRAQLAQQNICSPASMPCPTMRQPQCAQ